jgi:hypothetical protein
MAPSARDSSTFRATRGKAYGPVPEARAQSLCPCAPPPKTGERHQPRMRGAMGSGRMMRGGLPQRAL